MKAIDSHHHFWNPARGDYHWMDPDNDVLARQYAPQDLDPQRLDCGVERTVLVQAAATVNETEYLLGIADATPSVAGVVGWVDFENPDHRPILEQLARHPKFKGVRPMIQDIPDVDWMLREDIQWGFQAVMELDLCFDALGFPRHLPNFLTVLKRYPDLRVVIDHCMKPQIRDGSADDFQNWAEGMSRIADETRSFCKLSGLVTEAGEDWTPDDLRPYAHHVLDVFGPNRVMWGSDWPVCRLRAEYGEWHQTALALTSHLGDAAVEQVFSKSAIEFYRLQD